MPLCFAQELLAAALGVICTLIACWIVFRL
jgi:hypothetical protein